MILTFTGHRIPFKGDASSYFCPLDVDLEHKKTLVPPKEVHDALKASPKRSEPSASN